MGTGFTGGERGNRQGGSRVENVEADERVSVRDLEEQFRVNGLLLKI